MDFTWNIPNPIFISNLQIGGRNVKNVWIISNILVEIRLTFLSIELLDIFMIDFKTLSNIVLRKFIFKIDRDHANRVTQDIFSFINFSTDIKFMFF